MPTVSRARRFVFMGLAVAAVLGLATAAEAAHLSGSGSTSGTCAESPNPVAVGGIYTIAGSRLPASQLVNVSVTDARGTQWGSVMTSSTGTMTFTGQATVAGSYSVKITGGGRKASTYASCGFSAR